MTTYDENNNRTSQTDANGHTTSMEYDELNRLVKRIYPNPEGNIGTGADEDRFGYDANGNMVYKVTGSSTPLGDRDSTAFAYDSRNRETYRWYSNSGHTVETKYTTDSKRDTVIDHRGIADYDYNTDGRLEVVTNPDNTFIQYAYDSNGNKIEMATPWGTTQYSFDQLNRMKTVTSPDNEVTEYFYNAVGNRDSINHANGTSVGYEYDNLNRLTEVRNFAPDASVISSFTYELNNAGIRTAVTEADGSRVDYSYDDCYKLIGETRTGSNAYSIAYTYDNVGNRLTKDHDGVVTTYAYNNRDQVTSETNVNETITYTYDASGRTETKTDNSGVTTYGWADNDRMVSVTLPSGTVTYTYDADGNKVAVDDGAEARMYLVDMLQPYAQVIAEYDNAGSETVGYVYGLERISQDKGGSIQVFLADGQGSVRELTNSVGNATDTYDYYAFGEILNRTGSTENEWTYTGEAYDPNVGFIYFRARWVNPENGRFFSIDPFEGKVFDPVSLHKYLYANASPVTFIDPSGEMTLGEVMTAATVRVTLAVNRVTVAFASGGYAVGRAMNSLGKAVEQQAQNILVNALPRTVQMAPQIVVRGPGGRRIIDFWLQAGNRLALLEIKYKLPSKAGDALTRVANQMITYSANAQAFGDGGRVVLWTYKAPTVAEMTLLLSKLGPEAGKIQFAHGLMGLVQWVRFFFN